MKLAKNTLFENFRGFLVVFSKKTKKKLGEIALSPADIAYLVNFVKAK